MAEESNWVHNLLWLLLGWLIGILMGGTIWRNVFI